MKFNWRANWEILLVLVIIVVGIVITTIAAIRNKDKHLLPLAEETDFGQLLAASGGFSDSNGNANNNNNNNNSSSVSAQASSALDSDEGSAGSTGTGTEPTQPNSRRSPAAPLSGTNPKLRPAGHAFHPPIGTNNNNNHRDLNQHYNQHQEQNPARAHSKFDEEQAQHQQQVTSAARFLGSQSMGGETYEPMSTEPTPNQMRATEYPPNQLFQHNHISSLARLPHQLSGSRRNANRTTAAQQQQAINEAEAAGNYNDPLGESVDLIDDIHTTRSSLAAANANAANNPAGSSLSLHGPYGVATPSNGLNHNLLLAQQNKQQSGEQLADSIEDLMSLYPMRNNSSTNLTEALLRDYNLNAALNSNSSSQQLLNSAMLANLLSAGSIPTNQPSVGEQLLNPNEVFNQPSGNQQTGGQSPTHHRTFSSLLPISVILSDILKLTRGPHQQLPSNEQQQQQQSQLSTRQHAGILQQSRLPASLLSFLQGLSSSNNPASSAAGAVSADQMALPYDASESSQHYQRISMSPTDTVHSILARSLSGSGVLPAFPAPKGTTQTWIPPTAGGSADLNVAMNSNADFVAGNTAGFVRSGPQQSQQSAESGTVTSSSIGQQNEAYQRQSSPALGNELAAPFFYQQQHQTHQQTNTNQENQSHQQPQQYQHAPPASASAYEQQSSLLDQQRPQAAIFASSPTNQINDRSWPPASPTGAFPNAAGTNNNNNRQLPSSAHELESNSRRSLRPQSTNSVHNLMSQQQQSYMSLAQSRAIAQAAKPSRAPPSNHNNHNHNNIMSSPQTPSPQQTSFNGNINQAAAPLAMYNSRLSSSSSEIQVPLGYSQAPQQLHQMGPANNLKAQQSVFKQNGPNSNQPSPVNSPQKSGSSLSRRKRSATPPKLGDGSGFDRVDEVMSSRYGSSSEHDEEDDADSRPISVVRPDGRPMPNNGRLRALGSSPSTTNWPRPLRSANNLDREPAQSQRSANHLDMNSHTDRRKGSSLAKYSQHQRAYNKNNHLSGRNRKSEPRPHRNNHLETASSGLMSKLMGVASTNDELEEDMDDDEDSANEKRKEEIEDAEFGLNDERQIGPHRPSLTEISNNAANNDDNNNSPQLDSGPHKLQSDSGAHNGGDSSSGGHAGLGSGSTDNESYVRRNQQRSDIEFYGHPGEETRQLKYGILGSGNYEVVNGGIYPEADESTAAVNSVANYVRKPGAAGLLGLPKLLASGEAGTVRVQQADAAAYMPGGRVGGFLRGASTANAEDLVNLLNPNGSLNDKVIATGPLLELFDGHNNGHLFDPNNILAQLGSSGSQTRSTHTSQEGTGEEEDELQDEEARKRRKKEKEDKLESKTKKKKTSSQRKVSRPNSSERQTHSDEDNAMDEARDGTDNPGGSSSNQLQRQQSSISGSQHGVNQFNSYKISPSKKVTIFSDQDLDSAPSSMEKEIHQFSYSSHGLASSPDLL